MSVSTDGQICFGILLEEMEEALDIIERKMPEELMLVNVCSEDYPIYILALASSLHTAKRGYPVVFDPGILEVEVEDYYTLVNFAKSINLNSTPQWYLSSFWG